MTGDGRQVEDGGRRGRSRGGSSDRVELDVGGTVFSTSVSTLVSNSSYFDRLFSPEWHEEQNGTGKVFLDQDPGPFKVLLSFMRLGSVEAEDLTKEVLLQAVFLDMQRLLSAVRCTAYLNTYPNFKGSDEEACTAFDEEFGGIVEAVSNGLIPSRLTEGLRRKEYGHILLSHWSSLDSRRDPVAFLDVPSCHSDELTTKGSTDNIGYTTFLDALNFLSRRGFTMLETEIHEEFNIDVNRRLTFSRFARGDREECSFANVITQTNSKGVGIDGPKEFACIVDSYCPKEENEFVSVYADIGSKEVHATKHGDVVQVYSSIVPFNLRIAPGLEWLQQESYMQEETELGNLFEKLWNEQYFWRSAKRRQSKKIFWEDTIPEKHHYLKLLSRKCPRHKDEVVPRQNS